MKAFFALLLLVPSCCLSLALAEAQASGAPGFANAPQIDGSPEKPVPGMPLTPQGPHSVITSDLNWTPEAFAQLNGEATTRSNFTLDRTALGFAAALVPDSEAETRHAIAKLDGVSVHVLRFGASGVPDEAAVNRVRQAYRVPGWKHLVGPGVMHRTNTTDFERRNTTDLWVLLDGPNVREFVGLVESPASLTLVTVAGDISTVDLLRLRGHFGIPRFDNDQFSAAKNQ